MGPEPPRLFYDGHCALCHSAVRFVLRRDKGAPGVRIAPLGGENFNRLVTPEERSELPDSMVVLTPEGRTLIRSQAASYLLRRSGGAWPLVAATVELVPRRWRDALYDAVARRRHRWFGRSEEVCPQLPDALRRRFDP